MRKPDCETVNRVRVARIPARDRVICVNFSSISKNIFQNKNMYYKYIFSVGLTLILTQR